VPIGPVRTHDAAVQTIPMVHHHCDVFEIAAEPRKPRLAGRCGGIGSPRRQLPAASIVRLAKIAAVETGASAMIASRFDAAAGDLAANPAPTPALPEQLGATDEVLIDVKQQSGAGNLRQVP
jgi:hypothetical protein